jgi:hypothetical protein
MEVVVDEFMKEDLILAIRQLEDAARHQPKMQESLTSSRAAAR